MYTGMLMCIDANAHTHIYTFFPPQNTPCSHKLIGNYSALPDTHCCSHMDIHTHICISSCSNTEFSVHLLAQQYIFFLLVPLCGREKVVAPCEVTRRHET